MPVAPLGWPVYRVLEVDMESKVLTWLSKCVQAQIPVMGLIGQIVRVCLWVWLEEFGSLGRARETQI